MRAGVTASGALTVFGCRAALYRAHAARPHRSRMPSQLARSSVRVNRMYPSRRRHAHQERHLYSLGFNIVDKQGYLYYGLEGDSSAQQVFVTAQELTALAQMFRDGGQVVFNDNGGQFYFVTERQDITARAQWARPARATTAPRDEPLTSAKRLVGLGESQYAAGQLRAHRHPSDVKGGVGGSLAAWSSACSGCG